MREMAEGSQEEGDVMQGLSCRQPLRHRYGYGGFRPLAVDGGRRKRALNVGGNVQPECRRHGGSLKRSFGPSR